LLAHPSQQNIPIKTPTKDYFAAVGLLVLSSFVIWTFMFWIVAFGILIYVQTREAQAQEVERVLEVL
jgi:hypothetical protein